jgi:hypothetical protein
MMSRGWVLRRSFRLGRCLFRESRQRAAARDSYVHRRPRGIHRYLADNLAALPFARTSWADRWLAARWHLCLSAGWILEASRNHRPAPQCP